MDYAPALLAALNTTCLIPGKSDIQGPLPSILCLQKDSIYLSASPAELKTLDLYGTLEAMPKNSEVEHNAMDRDGDDISEVGGAGKEGGKVISKKELGRLKSKKALLDKVGGGGVEGKGKDKAELGLGGEHLEGRDAKRARGKSGNGDEVDDVVMIDS